MRTRSAIAAAALVGCLAACSNRQPPPDHLPLAVSVASAAPTSSQTALEPTEGELSSKDAKQVAKTLGIVSELRGVPATKPVPSRTLARDQLVARVKDKALREYPPEALRREGLLLQMLGFAPPNFDYLGEMLKLLASQLEGFYEPKNGTMYLAADLKGPEAQAALAHELVHALQDQQWDLRKRSDYKPGRGDETMALACLAEGDATSLMLDFAMKPDKNALDVPPDSLRAMMKGGMTMDDIQSVPHILRTTLVSPYMEGVAFVHELRQKGGWNAVNRAWERLPTTTEQILHVDKWEAQEGGIPVPAPSAHTLGEGWKSEDEDTFGELGFALAFAEWMDDDAARIAASGWGGDRTSVFTKGDELAHALHLRFDSAAQVGKVGKIDAFADRAFAKLAPALRKRLGKPTTSDTMAICFERKDFGPLLVTRKDRDFVMIAGPARIANGTWTSTGTCALAKKWAAEVTAQR